MGELFKVKKARGGKKFTTAAALGDAADEFPEQDDDDDVDNSAENYWQRLTDSEDAPDRDLIRSDSSSMTKTAG